MIGKCNYSNFQGIGSFLQLLMVLSVLFNTIGLFIFLVRDVDLLCRDSQEDSTSRLSSFMFYSQFFMDFTASMPINNMANLDKYCYFPSSIFLILINISIMVRSYKTIIMYIDIHLRTRPQGYMLLIKTLSI